MPENVVIDSNEEFGFVKADKKHGVVFGIAIVTKSNGKPYVDIQGDHIPDEAMLDGAVEFMKSQRQLGIEHKQMGQGTVLFAMPLTEDIKKSFNIECPYNGLIIGVKPENPKVVEMFENGQMKGFSIGGSANKADIEFVDTLGEE